jgi:hypothetical protein
MRALAVTMIPSGGSTMDGSSPNGIVPRHACPRSQPRDGVRGAGPARRGMRPAIW